MKVDAPAALTGSPRPAARLVLCGALFVALFAAYALSPMRTPYDSRWSIHTAASLLAGEWGELSAFQPVLASNGYYAIERRDSGLFTMFPIGVSVLAMPFVVVADLVHPGFTDALRTSVPGVFESIVASVLGALAGVAVFALARNRGASPVVALCIAALFAFATPMWSTATRALWQHGPEVLMLVLSMLLLERARNRPALAQYASLPLAAAYVIRPTSVIEIVVLSVYVFVVHRAWMLRYLAWSLPVALPWLAYNLAIHDSLLPSYYLASRIAGWSGFVEALAGHLVSPARGLLIYSPVLALAAWGAILDLRAPERRSLSLAFAAIPVAHWIAVSTFPHWWAGASYGPRLMIDAVPFLVWFLVPVFERARRLAPSRQAPAAAFVILLSVASVFAHARGATSSGGYAWNVVPEDVDKHPARLWDWGDPPFLRGLGAGRPDS